MKKKIFNFNILSASLNTSAEKVRRASSLEA